MKYTEIAKNGLWHNNPALVQLLGLCPLLAVTTSTVNGVGLGLATMLVLIASNLTVSCVRNWVRKEIRISVFVIIIASFVTTIELLMNAWLHQLHEDLSIFIPLIVTNCIIIGRAEAFASKNPVLPSMFDGFMMGLGFTLTLMLLGAMRELAGTGSLFAQAEILFGESARTLKITVFDSDHGFLLAILPPGAFIGLGLIVAVKNIIDRRLQEAAARENSAVPPIDTTPIIANQGKTRN